MATVLCVLYDDPVDGYPTTYARDDIPTIERYHDGQTTPTFGCWRVVIYGIDELSDPT